MTERSRKPKASQPTFPRECCLACGYMTADEHQNCTCWADPPFENPNQAAPPHEKHVRGKPVEPNWPACRDFKPHLHA